MDVARTCDVKSVANRHRQLVSGLVHDDVTSTQRMCQQLRRVAVGGQGDGCGAQAVSGQWREQGACQQAALPL